jgi:hypothetical protein
VPSSPDPFSRRCGRRGESSGGRGAAAGWCPHPPTPSPAAAGEGEMKRCAAAGGLRGLVSSGTLKHVVTQGVPYRAGGSGRSLAYVSGG